MSVEDPWSCCPVISRKVWSTLRTSTWPISLDYGQDWPTQDTVHRYKMKRDSSIVYKTYTRNNSRKKQFLYSSVLRHLRTPLFHTLANHRRTFFPFALSSFPFSMLSFQVPVQSVYLDFIDSTNSLFGVFSLLVSQNRTTRPLFVVSRRTSKLNWT